jgi:predicted RNase H-like nuclease (RuvC/YqgF family)
VIPIPISWLAAGAAGVIAVGAVGVQQIRIKSCQADLAETRSQLAVISAQVEEQNRAVEGWQAKAASAQATAAQERRKAEEAARDTKVKIARLQAILDAPKPAVENLTCVDALRELRGVR